MSTTSVSTASSFNAEMLQQTFDYAIEVTCRDFNLLSPFNSGANQFYDDKRTDDADAEEKAITNFGGMTYEGFIHQERLKKFPPSYYQIQEMNKGPVDYAPRLASIPSQYQLESLTEMYVCDYSRLYKSVNYCDANLQMESDTGPMPSKSDYLPSVMMNHAIQKLPSTDRLREVQSHYVSELLY